MPVLILALGIVTPGCWTTCDRTLLREIPSPSAGRLASLIAGDCESWSGVQIIITEPGEALGYGDSFFKILKMREDGYVEPDLYGEAIRFEWLSDNELKVSYPEWMWPVQRDPRADQVVIHYLVRPETEPARGPGSP
jgi:hypothetical protein